MAEATFIFKVEEELKTAFSNAAKALDQTDADVLREFMRAYVEEQYDAASYDAWFRQKVKKAIELADAGETVPGDEVEAEFAVLRDEARKSATR
ncbi:hypothetical protein KX729_19135 [Rhizobium sp. XQZ8]|uniref:CopG family ribbon-helix-helix protein n=1 Tax=Rhizobium populisoli TaxID=2859785 RepID=UPI001CA4F108|nr:hypothetical protein [Rhizobium populisoli]MBW6423576.1 hypothetical protein [Rhizobium populisoli]